jgi:hypothetical protein
MVSRSTGALTSFFFWHAVHSVASSTMCFSLPSVYTDHLLQAKRARESIQLSKASPIISSFQSYHIWRVFFFTELFEVRHDNRDWNIIWDVSVLWSDVWTRHLFQHKTIMYKSTAHCLNVFFLQTAHCISESRKTESSVQLLQIWILWFSSTLTLSRGRTQSRARMCMYNRSLLQEIEVSGFVCFIDWVGSEYI